MGNNKQIQHDFGCDNPNMRLSEQWHLISLLTIYYAREQFWAEDDQEPYSAYEIAANMYPEGSDSFKWIYNVMRYYPRYGQWETESGFPFIGTHPIPENAELKGGTYTVGRKRSNQFPGYLWLEKFSQFFEIADVFLNLGEAFQDVAPGLQGQPTDRQKVRDFVRFLTELTHAELIELTEALKGGKVSSPRVQAKLNILESFDGFALHYLRFLFKKEKTEIPVGSGHLEKRIKQRIYADIPLVVRFGLAGYRRLLPFLKRIPLKWKLASFGVAILLMALGVSAHYHEDRMYVLKTEGLAAWCSYLVSWGEDSDRFRYLSGYSLYRSGKYDDAYGVLLRLITDEDVTAKMKADAYYTLAHISLNQTRVYEAMGSIQRALEFYETGYYWSNAYKAALLKSSIEDNAPFDGADLSLQNALRFAKYDKGNTITHLGLWNQFHYYHLLRERKFQQAEEAARKAMACFAKEGDQDEAMIARCSVSFALALNGDFEEALIYLRKAEAWFNRSMDLQMMKYCDVVWVVIEGAESKSRRDIESWLSTMGNDPELGFLLELALENSNQEPDNERNQIFK